MAPKRRGRKRINKGKSVAKRKATPFKVKKPNRQLQLSSESENDSARGEPVEAQNESGSEESGSIEDAGNENTRSGSDSVIEDTGDGAENQEGNEQEEQEDEEAEDEEDEEEEDVGEDSEQEETEDDESTSEDDEPENQAEERPRKNWKDAGLNISCSQVHRMGKHLTGMKIDREVSVFFTSVIENVIGEIALAASQRAAAKNKRRINPRLIMEAVKGDEDLKSIKAWPNSVFRGTGVYAKGIHPALLPPPQPVRRRNNKVVPAATRAKKREAQDSNQPGPSGIKRAALQKGSDKPGSSGMNYKRILRPRPGIDDSSSDDD